MVTVLKVVFYSLVALGWLFIFAVLVGKFISVGNRRATRYTVVWKDTDVMLQAFTGTIEPVGEHHIKVEDDKGWAVMVDRRDIKEVY
jgi:preprotein translocase subunit YajC